MMLFSEWYSAYYTAVTEILKAAIDHPLRAGEWRRIIEERAFGESVLNIEPALTQERWQLVKKDGTTPIKNVPTMPFTAIQKRWLKAVSLDPRIRLFQDAPIEFPDVEPLFLPEDVCVFDRYADGDNYEDPAYIKRFRLILDAVRNRTPLHIEMANRRGRTIHITLIPDYLEYSEKDDKFRMVGFGRRYKEVVNLGRIARCEHCAASFDVSAEKTVPDMRSVEFMLLDERNTLERVLLHFAHFEKQAERLEGNHYKVTVRYEKEDETEIVIRLLSFGPMVKVIGPQTFVDRMKERLVSQKTADSSAERL